MNRFGALLLAMIVPLSASLLGCYCDDELVITEEFESFCDGIPCGWTASGPVSQVPTFHDNVYGVAIPAGTTLTSGEAFGLRPPRILVRCDAGASLRLNGNTQNAPVDSFAWVSSSQTGNTSIDVTGSGQCVVDDVGFIDFCDGI